MEDISENMIPFASAQESSTLYVKDKWARRQLFRQRLQHTHEMDQFGAKIRDIEDFLGLGKLVENNEWKSQLAQPKQASHEIDIPLTIRTTFEKLEEDFSDFSNRIVWCDELKNCLSKFEEELEEYDAKYLSWFVSTLKDVFSYNYAETITEEQLDLLKNGVETIYGKQGNCDKDSFTEYHLQLVESGLSLLPTTQKAIDEFGE